MGLAVIMGCQEQVVGNHFQLIEKEHLHLYKCQSEDVLVILTSLVTIK